MRDNPYQDAIKRYGRIIAGSLGAILCLVVDIVILVSGSTTGITGRTGIAQHVYTRAHDPSQFWFAVVLFALFGIAAGWYAWDAYRE